MCYSVWFIFSFSNVISNTVTLKSCDNKSVTIQNCFLEDSVLWRELIQPLDIQEIDLSILDININELHLFANFLSSTNKNMWLITFMTKHMTKFNQEVMKALLKITDYMLLESLRSKIKTICQHHRHRLTNKKLIALLPADNDQYTTYWGEKCVYCCSNCHYYCLQCNPIRICCYLCMAGERFRCKEHYHLRDIYENLNKCMNSSS